MKRVFAAIPIPAWIALAVVGLLAAWLARDPPHRKPVVQAVAQPISIPPAPPPPPEPIHRTVLEHGQAKPLAAAQFHTWSPGEYEGPREDQRKADPQTYRIGGVTLTLASAEGAIDLPDHYQRAQGLMLRISAPGIRTRTLEFPFEASTYFGVGRIDMSRPGPQLLFHSDSGGRRCCERYYLLSPGRGGVWRLDKLEQWNLVAGDWPRDRDGDGSPELRVLDETFVPYPWPELYEWAPSRYFQIEAGKAIDVSARPGLAGEYRREMRRAAPACRKGENAACTSLVANASRVGRQDWAWKIMLRSYDPDGGIPWLYCEGPEHREACKTPKTAYPATLHGFLAEAGYEPAMIERAGAGG